MWVTAWESRTSPGLFFERAAVSARFFISRTRIRTTGGSLPLLARQLLALPAFHSPQGEAALDNARTLSPVTPTFTVVDWVLLTVRLVAGIIFTAHGAQKLFGAWGGVGLSGMIEQMGPVLGVLVTIGEFFGGLGLIVGFLSRFSAASLIVIMLGAIAMVHGKNGFFMSTQGFEYNLALIGLLVPTLIAGPGRLAIGRYLPLPTRRDRSGPMLVLE
jgi:putative oxidoreductase